MSDHKMTVEVPVHVTIEFDNPLQVDQNTDPTGIPEMHRMVDHAEPTDEFRETVTELLESESVSVNKVYAANGYTLTTD